MKLAAYLLMFLGVPALASLIRNQTFSAVLGIIYILLLIPFGILKAIDFYRTNDGKSLFARAFKAIFRVPLALLGLLCLVTGISIIGWVLYNVFVERQKEYSGPQFIIGFGSFGVGAPLVVYGYFTLRSVMRRKEELKLTPEEQEEFDREEEDEEHAGDRMDKRNLHHP